MRVITIRVECLESESALVRKQAEEFGKELQGTVSIVDAPKEKVEKTEKADELSERTKMKVQDIASKAINQKKKKPTVTKKVQESEDEEIHILFQAVPLIEELNSIRNIKVQKKLSAGVKLARQILDI